ncbi:sensor histidine kinase [Hyalangium minutum]|uniref:histidine kinase n=1 Tax=Hyalangium minutum TaxID=394096 RepID=A0A085WQL0_9BACT|nr:PAS domain-containing sensor histidine kinase [Hyalangium minutum]KFE69973.1 Flagellar sensor histidine kinase FleS [Hyalangium minutum]
MKPSVPQPPSLPGPPSAPALQDFARTQRRAGRSALFGLALLGLVALTSPLLAYREELENAREEALAHLSVQAQVQAEALGVHLQLLEAELQRLAQHPKLILEDGPAGPEVTVLDNALHHTHLFSEGVVLLSASGRRVWSDPPAMALGESPVTTRPWFRRVQREGVSDINLLEREDGPLVVAVPVVRGGRQVVGMLVGELRAGAKPLPGVSAKGTDLTLLVSLNGKLLLPMPPQNLRWTTQLASDLIALVHAPGRITLADTAMLGAAAPVPVPAGVSGMLLAVLENEEHNVAPLRYRFLSQLILHSALLISTLIVFVFLLRRSYRSLLRAEERLRHQETMAALGSASQLIAHEVKNALNGIQAALSLLRPASSSGEVALPALRAQVQRLGHLARSLLSFGEPRPMLRRPCDLRLLVDEALQSLRLLPEAEDVRIGVTMAEGLTVHVDPALLVAAIDNLLRNAVEAGAVARDTGLRPAPWVQVSLAREGAEAVLLVEDNAGGVDPKLEPRLWEPFATARAKGIGLGLPMARTAVEAHGGSLTYTRLPEGSRFSLRLPLESAA